MAEAPVCETGISGFESHPYRPRQGGKWQTQRAPGVMVPASFGCWARGVLVDVKHIVH